MSASGNQCFCQDLCRKTSHRVTTFEYGLQGVEVEGDTPVFSGSCVIKTIIEFGDQSKDNGAGDKKNHRVELNRVGISTVLDVEDTVSHSFELHRYSPVLHPLFI